MSRTRKARLDEREHARMAKYWSVENGLMVCDILRNGVLSEVCIVCVCVMCGLIVMCCV